MPSMFMSILRSVVNLMPRVCLDHEIASVQCPLCWRNVFCS